MKGKVLNAVYALKGRFKFLSIDATGVHISYNKLFTKGDRTISFSQIISVEVKKPGLTNGYIYFQTAGNKDQRQTNVNDIAVDDNSVVFVGRDKYETALAIKQYVEQQQQIVFAPTMNQSAADEVLKYKQLLDTGAITKEEFETKKRQLLG